MTPDLLYRRQFLLGPTDDGRLPTWRRTAIGDRLVLRTHPDLTCDQARSGTVEVTVMGDIVDPEHPERTNGEVLADLASTVTVATEAPRLTARLVGRWALVADDGRSSVLFHDAAGLRQIHYCLDPARGPWCASQAERIAEQLGLLPDDDARAFLRSQYVTDDPEYSWPGDTSLYREVRRLLPNHYLDLRAGTAHRFWPWSPIAPASLADAVDEGAALLRGAIRGASRRFPLALPLTAGFDSRLILAASRDSADSLFIYTLQLPGLGRGHADLTVPPRLLRRLGLQHHAIAAPQAMDREFADVYRRSTEPAHPVAGVIAQGLLRAYPAERVSLTGHASEIVRSGYYHLEPYPADLSGIVLAKRAMFGDNSFATHRFSRWLDNALPLQRTYGVKALDLFYWEQRVGSWAASGEAEWDVVHDRFAPFSCRDLIALFLGVDIAYRREPNYRLYTEMIRALWPETLQLPVNPPPTGLRRLGNAVARRWRRRSTAI